MGSALVSRGSVADFTSRQSSPLLGDGDGLRDVLPRVLRQYLVDERLIADTPRARLAAERLEDARIDTNGDQLTRFFPERRPTAR